MKTIINKKIIRYDKSNLFVILFFFGILIIFNTYFFLSFFINFYIYVLLFFQYFFFFYLISPIFTNHNITNEFLHLKYGLQLDYKISLKNIEKIEKIDDVSIFLFGVKIDLKNSRLSVLSNKNNVFKIKLIHPISLGIFSFFKKIDTILINTNDKNVLLNYNKTKKN